MSVRTMAVRAQWRASKCWYAYGGNDRVGMSERQQLYINRLLERMSEDHTSCMPSAFMEMQAVQSMRMPLLQPGSMTHVFATTGALS